MPTCAGQIEERESLIPASRPPTKAAGSRLGTWTGWRRAGAEAGAAIGRTLPTGRRPDRSRSRARTAPRPVRRDVARQTCGRTSTAAAHGNLPHTHPGGYWSGVYLRRRWHSRGPRWVGRSNFWTGARARPCMHRISVSRCKAARRRRQRGAAAEVCRLVLFPSWLLHQVRHRRRSRAHLHRLQSQPVGKNCASGVAGLGPLEVGRMRVMGIETTPRRDFVAVVEAPAGTQRRGARAKKSCPIPSTASSPSTAASAAWCRRSPRVPISSASTGWWRMRSPRPGLGWATSTALPRRAGRA